MSDEGTIWFVVRELNNDVRRLEDRWSTLLESTTRVASSVESISDQVEKLSGAVLSGNPGSVMDRMYALQTDVSSVRTEMKSLTKTNDEILNDLNHMKKMTGVFRTEEEAHKEKWQAIGRISAVILAVVSSIVALIRTIHL